MPPTARCGAVLAAFATAALAAPAGAAAAPTVALDFPCYTPGMAIGLSGSGFTPGGPVGLTVAAGGGLHSYTGSAAPTGRIAGSLPLPEPIGPEQQDGSLTAVDRAQVPPGQPPGPEQTAVAAFKTSPWYMDVPGWGDGSGTGSGRRGRRTRVAARGFVGTASTTLYAHYVRRGRHVKTTRVGALTGPCADLDGRFRQFPFRAKRGAVYAVTFDTTRAWPNRDAGIVYPRVRAGWGRRAARELHATRRVNSAPAPRPG